MTPPVILLASISQSIINKTNRGVPMADQTTFDIFVNYRRQDSRADAGRIYDRLSTHFGDDHVFMDIDDINPGENFVQILDDTLDYCAILLVIIGDNWVDSENEDGQRRLDQPNDFVRQEIQRAIERQITVIPVLVGYATMPLQEELPPEIASFCQHQALEISDTHFHPDVDRLIDELELINVCKKSSNKIKPLLSWSLITLILLSLATGLYYGMESYLLNLSLQKQLQLHLNVGDQFLELQDYKGAIKEFEKARNISPDSIEPYLKITRANRKRMLSRAFTGGSSLNIGLRKDYAEQFAPIDFKQISAALNIIYKVQELDPSLKDDPNLLLDEALILKASVTRIKNAIVILQKAKELAPHHTAILAELGLFNAVLLKKPEGIDDIRHAIEISPANARYHFYLARALAEIYLCPYSGYDYSGSGDEEGCANAIKEYHQAIELATGNDKWSQHIRYHSITGGLDIFHRYSRKEKDIVTQGLAMSIDERINELEFMIPLEHNRSRTGHEDEPLYWLALLYESKNQINKASQLMRQLLIENNYRSVLWMKYQVKLLENTGDDQQELNKIRSLLKGK